jgi:hypothetical protein
MTDELITLGALVEKSPDADLLREMIGFTGQHLMELWVESLTGAKHGERSPERINQSNGDRARESRVGRVELRIPKLKRGSYFPVLFLEPRRMAEKPSPRLCRRRTWMRSGRKWMPMSRFFIVNSADWQVQDNGPLQTFFEYHQSRRTILDPMS